MNKISSFEGKYRFLSNFSNHLVTFDGLTYKNSEAAFHAQKDPSRAKEFVNLNPSQAKRLGRRVKLRDDWEQVKDDIMFDIVMAKFQQHGDIREKLIETKGIDLEEGNTWGDKYWGTVDGKGKNKLGKILMRVRDILCGEDI